MPPAGLFQEVVETSPQGLIMASKDGRVCYANESACELFGGDKAMLQGRKVSTLFWFMPHGPEAPDTLTCTALNAADALLLRSDGSLRWVQMDARPMRGGNWQAWVRDVSAHRKGPAWRQDINANPNASLLRTVFDMLPVGVWLTDREGHIVGNNPAADRIWERERPAEHGHMGEYRAWKADTGAPIPAEDSAFARAVIKSEVSNGELVRIRCFDGSFKTIINSAAPLRDQDGEVYGAVVVNEDITCLHQAQEQQRAGEELLRTVFNLLPMGLWLADRDGRISLSNPAGEHMWHGLHPVGPEEYRTHKGWRVDTGEPIAPEDWGLARALRGETCRSELARIQCFDGSFKTVINWAAPLRSAGGEIVGAIAANEDVTALQHMQEQLRAAVRDRERILAVVAHDLRSPLVAVMSYSAAMEIGAAKLEGGERLRANAAALQDIGRRMSGLVDDLLAVAVVESAGHNMVEAAAVDCASLLRRAAQSARPQMADRGLELEIRCADELLTVRADADRILRVLSNLLDNALKYTKPPGTVILSAKPTAGGMLFCVANSGPAVAQAQLEVMFQPFWQAQRDKAGTGLGLSICRSIVQAHGGTIWAEPAEGHRLRVCFVLPRA